MRLESPTRMEPAPASRMSPFSMVVMALALAASAAAVVWLLLPKSGTLIVNVSGPGGTAIEMVSVLVDGAERCTKSPCRLDLEQGDHKIQIVAPGFAKAADKLIPIQGGGTAVLDFSLSPGSGEGGSTGTGIRVGDLGQGLRLTVDGVDKGPLPTAVTDLTPGEHTIRISGSDRFEAYESQVNVEAGSVRLLEPTLRAVKGTLQVMLAANAAGSTTTLVCGSDRRLLNPPTKVQIDADKSCTVKATKVGMPDFSADVRFSGPDATATVTVQFGAPSGPVAGGGAASPATPSRPAWLGGAVAGGGTPTPATPAPAAGMGTISINSIPVSSVLVDGKPAGQTPTRVTVSAGAHSVTFIHKEKGRKTVGVQVPAGGNANATVRL